jgi:hypothetical protein
MAGWNAGREIVLGQAVHLRTDPSERLGFIVAVMMTHPYEALVRWRDAEPTFEALDSLVEASRRPIGVPVGGAD